MAYLVLIVDDSKVFRALERAILQQHGHTVIEAENGVEAVRMAIEQSPDIILLDIQMPVMDGVTVLSTLKASPATRNIPVIIITTIGRENDRDILLRGGADDFVSKPISGPELLNKVESLLGAPAGEGTS